MLVVMPFQQGGCWKGSCQVATAGRPECLLPFVGCVFNFHIVKN